MAEGNYIISLNHFPYIEYNENNHILRILVRDTKHPCLDLSCISNWEKPYENESIKNDKKEIILIRIFNWITKNKKDDINFSLILRDRNITNYYVSKDNRKKCIYNHIKNGVVYLWGKRIGAINELETFSISKIMFDRANNIVEFYENNDFIPCFVVHNPSRIIKKINKIIIKKASVISRGNRTLYYVKNGLLINNSISYSNEGIKVNKEILKKQVENNNYNFIGYLDTTKNDQQNTNIIISHERKITDDEFAFAYIRKETNKEDILNIDESFL